MKATRVGYGSASSDDDARAEIWVPLWSQPATYSEIKYLLREGRASVEGRAATNAMEFAEAACSLGVDRGIDRFVRYSLLKRRGDSYVALAIGTFPVQYRSQADLVRQFQPFFESFVRRGLPPGAEQLRRGVDVALYDLLLKGGTARMRELMAAFGRLVRRTITSVENFYIPPPKLHAATWLNECGFDSVEVRIAASLSSLDHSGISSMKGHLSRGEDHFSWTGFSFADRLTSVLIRRIQRASADGIATNPLGGLYYLDPGDVTVFLEGSVDDDLIEDLLFAFSLFDWRSFRTADLQRQHKSQNEILPVYAVLKHLFLPGEIKIGDSPKTLRADSRILPFLQANRTSDAADIALHRLRISGFQPLQVRYEGGWDAHRLAGALLIPVKWSPLLAKDVFQVQGENN